MIEIVRELQQLLLSASLIGLAIAGLSLIIALFWKHFKFKATRLLERWRALPVFAQIAFLIIFTAFYLHGSVKQTQGSINRFDKNEIYSGVSDFLSVENSLKAGTDGVASTAEYFRITAFNVDKTNRTIGFEVSWGEDLFNNTLSRNLHLFSSTNLLERRWIPLGVHLMPSGTNVHSFIVGEGVVADSEYTWFYGLFNGAAFFRLGIDVDSDADGLTDSYEKFYTFTEPVNPDTDGDSILDGIELDCGLDPVVPETPTSDFDEDGLTHSQELAFGSNPVVADSDGDGLSDGVEWRYGWDPNWPGETDEANAPGGAFTTFDKPFSVRVDFENPHPEEATVYGQGEGESVVSLDDLVTRDPHKDIASTVTNNIISVETLQPKPVFTTNVTGVLIVKLLCDDYGVLRIGDLSVTNSWPNKNFVKAWKVIEANSVNEVDVQWDSHGGSKWNFDYECYFYPEMPQVRLFMDVPEGVAIGGKRRKATFSFDSDVETNGVVVVSCVNGADKISLWSDEINGIRLPFSNSWDVSSTNSFSCYVQGEVLSGYQEIEFECAYVPASGPTKAIRKETTVFACYTQPIENNTWVGYQVVNPSFLSSQSNAAFRVEVIPVDIPESKINWRTVAGTALFPLGTNGVQTVVRGVSGDVDLEVNVLGVSEETMHLRSKVIQHEGD